MEHVPTEDLQRMVEEGRLAAAAGDLGAACARFESAAEQGSAVAKRCLGVIYVGGARGPEQRQRGLDLLREAAENGQRQAQLLLGVLHAKGELVAQNADEAVKWLGRAAESGDPDAQTMLGIFHHLGWGVPRSEAEARRWLARAESAGSVVAAEQLAELACLDGEAGVERPRFP